MMRRCRDPRNWQLRRSRLKAAVLANASPELPAIDNALAIIDYVLAA